MTSAIGAYGIFTLTIVAMTALGSLFLGVVSAFDAAKWGGISGKKNGFIASMWSGIGFFLLALLLSAIAA